MKILIITQHYWPEIFRVTDIAESLVDLGHDVTVLCGLPNYPKGYVFEEYKRNKNRIEEHNNVKIIRAKEIGRRKGTIFRLLNYWSYPYFAGKLVRKLERDFNVVFTPMTSPIMMSKPAIKYAKRSKKKIVMYEMDLWPESLLAGGISRKSMIYKHYKNISSRIYSKCDKILVSTKEHINYINNLPNCNGLSIEYLPQYADTLFEKTTLRHTNNGIIDLMFAGNIGKAQSIVTIIKAASILKDNNRFVFHIVGDGSELETNKKIANELNLKNVIFYGQKPLEEMPKLYEFADVMLVTLENKEYANMTIPGKVQSYMAVGKPVVGAINGSGSDFIKNNKIGFVCNAEDYEGLANIIANLDYNELLKIGEHAKKVYFEKYSKKIFMNTLVSNLEKYSQ